MNENENNLKTILVTGGAGYIGSFTTRELLNNGFSVVILDSLENGHIEAVDKRAIFEKGNVGNPDDLKKIFDKYDIGAVIDFAAYLAVGESMSDPEKYLKNNVLNFISLLNEMTKEGRPKLLIKSSTASVYGEPQSVSDFPLKESYVDSYKPEQSCLLPGNWQGEDVEKEDFFQKFITLYHTSIDNDALKLDPEEITKLRIPTSIYGLSKLLDEILMKKYNKLSEINSIALRYFNVCGGTMDGEYGDDKPVPTNLMSVAILATAGQRPSIKVFGNDYDTPDGTGIRDYIHPLDLASGHLAALKYLLSTNQSGTFNLGRGTGYSVLEVIEAIKKAAGKEVPFEMAERRAGDMAVSLANPKEAENILEWKARYTLSDMAESAWKWQEKYPNGYEDKNTEDRS